MEPRKPAAGGEGQSSHCRRTGFEAGNDDDTIIRQLSPDILDMQNAFDKHREVILKTPLVKEKLTA